MQKTIRPHQTHSFVEAERIYLHKINSAIQLMISKGQSSVICPGPINDLSHLNWPFYINGPIIESKKSNKFSLLEILVASIRELKGRPLIIIMRPTASLTCCYASRDES